MKPGNVFTIEPIFLMKNILDDYKIWNDRFTIVSPNNPSGMHMFLKIMAMCRGHSPEIL